MDDVSILLEKSLTYPLIKYKTIEAPKGKEFIKNAIIDMSK
tara:strand:+ start:929 stop:1051 length:123 start_codon:yes stop_codon:yes gene_type:complete